MNISTKSKIYFASLINSPFVFIFDIFFGTKIIKVKRRGILWELDLTEGIDFSIFIFGLFEKETSQAIKRLVANNSIVIDIGANIGAHTLPMANLVGREGKVYAIEPTKYAYSKLKKNLLINKFLSKRVQADQIMLINNDNKIKIKDLYSSWPLSNGYKNEKRHSVHQGVLRTTCGAKQTTLDDYVSANNISSLDLIKLDVDGNELEIIKGAKNVLKNMKTTLIMELAPEQYDDINDFYKVVKILTSMKYSFYSLDEKFTYPSKLHDLIKYIPKNGSINVVVKR